MFSDVLLLILGLSSVLSGGIPMPKPGDCPDPLNYPCPVYMMNMCATDWDCEGTFKCCKYQCNKQCVNPLGAKTNPCPYNTYDPKLMCLDKKYNNMCDEDSQCPGTDRCCCSGCARTCTPTVPVNPGHCPIPPFCPVMPTALKPPCKNDGQCTENKKCCSMCGMKCVTPIPDNPGKCPDVRELLVPCDTCYPDKCANDQGCGRNMKCCDYGCMKICVKPVS